MKSTFLLILLTFSSAAFAQKDESASPGRKKVQVAYEYQAQLADSTITIDEVIANWREVAADRDVKKDVDALAIAFGSEGLLELQKGAKLRADSLLARGVPLFRLKHSKAYFLVAFAELDRELKHYPRSIRSYDEILNSMDSMPELWDIEYYRLSGYAPYAYAINAALGLGRIGKASAEHRKQVTDLLTVSLEHHPSDPVGLMDLVALHYYGAIKKEDYKFKLDLLCSRKPELRKIGERFESEIGGAAAGKKPKGK